MIRLISIDPRHGGVFGTPETSSLPSALSLTAPSSYSLGCIYSVDLKDSMLGPKYGCFILFKSEHYWDGGDGTITGA
jgi:hypothetical protein